MCALGTPMQQHDAAQRRKHAQRAASKQWDREVGRSEDLFPDLLEGLEEALRERQAHETDSDVE